MANQEIAAPVSFWNRQKPVRSVLRVLDLLVTVVLHGLIGAGVAWAPLHLDGVWVGSLGLCCGLFIGGLTVWPYIAVARGKRVTPRRWALCLIALDLVLLVSIITVSGVQIYNTGFLPPLEKSRIATFDRLWRAMRDNYPDYSSKGVDWDEVYARHSPQIGAAQSNEEFFSLLAVMLSELDDGHTGVPEWCLEPLHFWAMLREIEGQPVVIWSTAEVRQMGLDVGAIVLEVDGRPVEHLLDTMPACLLSASTPWRRKAQALHFLLTSSDTITMREVVFQAPSGESRTITLSKSQATLPAQPSAASKTDTAPLIVARRLPSGMGLIHISSFMQEWGANLVGEFDVAWADLVDTPGLIVDLRGNSGGQLVVAMIIAGRLVDQPLVFGQLHFRKHLPHTFWRLWWDVRVLPRRLTYQGPLVVLVDVSTASAAEIFAAGLQDTGRAVIVGRRTTGSANVPVIFRLADGVEVYYSAGVYSRSNGDPIEGVGVRPDIFVEWTITDLREGRDPDVAAAEAYLAAMGGGGKRVEPEVFRVRQVKFVSAT